MDDTKPTDITVRRAEAKDTEGLLRLLGQIAALHHKGRPDVFKGNVQKYTEQEVLAILRDPDKPVFVAADRLDTVVGYVFCVVTAYEGHAVFQSFKSLYIDDFCVDEQRRGQQVGRKLFEAVKTHARALGVYNIDLNVWEFNQGAVAFYQSCGMTTQRRRMELVL